MKKKILWIGLISLFSLTPSLAGGPSFDFSGTLIEDLGLENAVSGFLTYLITMFY